MADGAIEPFDAYEEGVPYPSNGMLGMWFTFGCIGLVLNSLIIAVILKHRKKFGEWVDTILLNNAISDLGLAVLSTMTQGRTFVGLGYLHDQDRSGVVFCQFNAFMNHFWVGSTLCCLSVLALCRYLMVCHEWKMSNRTVLKFIAGSYVWSFFVSMVPFFEQVPSPSRMYCFPNFAPVSPVIIASAILDNFTIMGNAGALIFMYYNIFKQFRKTNMKAAGKDSARAEQKNKAVLKTSIILVSLFVGFNSPFVVANLVYYFSGWYSRSFDGVVTAGILMGVMLNPIVYMSTLPKYKNAVLNLVFCGRVPDLPDPLASVSRRYRSSKSSGVSKSDNKPKTAAERRAERARLKAEKAKAEAVVDIKA